MTMTEQFHFNLGFYNGLDKIMNFVNSLDTSSMSNKEFRKILNLYILDARP